MIVNLYVLYALSDCSRKIVILFSCRFLYTKVDIVQWVVSPWFYLRGLPFYYSFADTLCAFISWTFCSTKTSGRRLSTVNVPNSLTTKLCYTGNTTQGSAWNFLKLASINRVRTLQFPRQLPFQEHSHRLLCPPVLLMVMGRSRKCEEEKPLLVWGF